MALKLKELAELVGGQVVGDGEVLIERVAPIDSAKPGEITFVSNPKYAMYIRTTQASALIVSPQLVKLKRNMVVVVNPYLAYAKIVGAMMEKRPARPVGIHPTAVVSHAATLGEGAGVGPHAVVEDGAQLGNGATIHAGVCVGRNVVVGEDTEIHPNTVIYYGCRIGKRCIIHANVTIGSDGFGWAPDGKRYERIPQVGIVDVGDDVSIGAGTIINRGALGNTVIGRGTKIDSLVIISHNVEVGQDCLFVSQAGISGSVKIGSSVRFGGQSGVVGHVKIGDNVDVGAQSGVSHDLASNGTYFGSPARPMNDMKRTVAALNKLPELRDEIRHVQKRMAEITAMLDRDDDSDVVRP